MLPIKHSRDKKHQKATRRDCLATRLKIFNNLIINPIHIFTRRATLLIRYICLFMCKYLLLPTRFKNSKSCRVVARWWFFNNNNNKSLSIYTRILVAMISRDISRDTRKSASRRDGLKACFWRFA